jgi:hypothetical protein
MPPLLLLRPPLQPVHLLLRLPVKRIEGAGAVTASEHIMCGKVAYGETSGVELHRTVVVTSEATNREEGMSQTGSNKDVVKAEWS